MTDDYRLVCIVSISLLHIILNACQKLNTQLHGRLFARFLVFYSHFFESLLFVVYFVSTCDSLVFLLFVDLNWSRDALYYFSLNTIFLCPQCPKQDCWFFSVDTHSSWLATLEKYVSNEAARCSGMSVSRYSCSDGILPAGISGPVHLCNRRTGEWRRCE